MFSQVAWKNCSMAEFLQLVALISIGMYFQSRSIPFSDSILEVEYQKPESQHFVCVVVGSRPVSICCFGSSASITVFQISASMHITDLDEHYVIESMVNSAQIKSALPQCLSAFSVSSHDHHMYISHTHHIIHALIFCVHHTTVQCTLIFYATCGITDPSAVKSTAGPLSALLPSNTSDTQY